MPTAISNDARFTIGADSGPRLKTVQIKVPVVGLYSAPDKTGSIETQLLYGHSFDVYKENQNGWLWGQTRSPVNESDVAGYVGWIEVSKSEEGEVPTHIVMAMKALVFSKPNIKTPITLILPLGSLVTVKKTEDNFHQTSAGFIHSLHLSEISASRETVDFVSVAERHMGLPYIWGGISTDGLDCSGLVLSSLRATGRDALRDADVQEQSLGETIVTDSPLKRGDLIFWAGHVGIMQNGEDLLHANVHHMLVTSEPLKEAVSRIGPIRTIKRLNE